VNSVPLASFRITKSEKSPMDLKIIITGDGSHSLYNKRLDEIYHSKNGAIAESEHVFISAGFDFVTLNSKKVNLLEVGFGTGLNTLLTALKSKTADTQLEYWAFEPFPVNHDILNKLNYTTFLPPGSDVLWKKIHTSPWNKRSDIDSCIQIIRINEKVEHYKLPDHYFNLIYFDAFAPSVQAELWTGNLFRRLFTALKNGGVLVTYSARGEVRRNLKAVGFTVDRLPGPEGKREMIRAIKEVND